LGERERQGKGTEIGKRRRRGSEKEGVAAGGERQGEREAGEMQREGEEGCDRERAGARERDRG